MPPDRHNPTSPRKNAFYLTVTPVNSPEDSMYRPTRLPSFSNFHTCSTPPPPSTPPAYTSPFRVETPPSSTYTPSSLAAGLPVTPTSPTTYYGLPPPTLFQTSFLQDQGTTHHRGDTSPSEDYVPRGPGLQRADNPEDRKTVPKSAGPITESSTRSSDPVKCKWRGCVWARDPSENVLWSQHLSRHFDSSLSDETTKDGKATCMWDTCKGSRLTKACWNLHIRNHDGAGFLIPCSHCPRTYVTEKNLARHMAKDHPSVAGGGASGSGRR